MGPIRREPEAIEDYLALFSAPLREETGARLGLLIYCHITEIDAVYELLANMLLIIAGERYSIVPFADYTKATGKPTRDPIQRIEALKTMESNVGRGSLAPLFVSEYGHKYGGSTGDSSDSARGISWHFATKIHRAQIEFRGGPEPS